MGQSVEVENFVACLGTNEVSGLLAGAWHREGQQVLLEKRVARLESQGPGFGVQTCRVLELEANVCPPIASSNYTAENTVPWVIAWSPRDRRAQPSRQALQLQPEGLSPRHKGFVLFLTIGTLWKI